jgi:hypothetical protein
MKPLGASICEIGGRSMNPGGGSSRIADRMDALTAGAH